MSMTLPLRILALAAAYGRVGMVFMVEGELKYWEISRKAATSTKYATGITEEWISDLVPGVVVTEKCCEKSKKSEDTKAIIDAIAYTARRNKLLSASVVRPREYKNKYEEAAALAVRYPDLAPWLPVERKFYDSEPKNTVLFEALVLADTARRSGSIGLAAAMG